MDFSEAGIGALFVALLGGVGYLGKRWLSRSRRHETTALYSNVADLMTRLRAEGLSLQDVQEFEAQIRTRVRQVKATPIPRTHESRAEEPEPDTYWTTHSMVDRATASLGVREAELEAVLAELRSLLPDARGALLENSQEAWCAYRTAEAHLAASEFEGGTIMPIIRASEAESMTEERIKRVRAMVAEVRRQRY